jgi:broad specificity phosphatase PhoE
MTELDTRIILCVSHNSRIRCFLSKLFGKVEMKRFLNCAILEIKIENNNCTVKLIYPGEKGANIEKPYEKFYISSSEFDKYHSIHSIHSIFMDNTTIYLVRHAEGQHNTKMVDKSGKKQTNEYKDWKNYFKASIGYKDAQIDPPLTETGKMQAKKAASALVTHMNITSININYVFTSELKRTRETAYHMLSDINKQKSIYPIPCIHEITDYAKGSCDQVRLNLNLLPTAAENRTNCDQPKMQNTLECTEYNTDWSVYNALSKIKCSKTNLLRNIDKAIVVLSCTNNNNIYDYDYKINKCIIGTKQTKLSFKAGLHKSILKPSIFKECNENEFYNIKIKRCIPLKLPTNCNKGEIYDYDNNKCVSIVTDRYIMYKPNTRPLGSHCEHPQDCVGSAICVDNKCVRPPEEKLSKKEENRRKIKFKFNNLILGKECDEDKPCEGNQHCIDNKCIEKKCENNNECEKDETCVNHRCHIENFIECNNTDKRCKLGYICNRNDVCAKSCTKDNDCDHNEECLNEEGFSVTHFCVSKINK